MTLAVSPHRIGPAVPVHAVVLDGDALARAMRNRAAGARPLPSTTSYCSSGIGRPPSIMASRASLSIGDSARPSASGIKSRTATMPRVRPARPRPATARAASMCRCAARRRASQRARTPQAARDLDRCPRRRGGRPSADHDQRCAVAAMHHQTVGRTQSRARRTEHVKSRRFFGVEAVQLRRRCRGRPEPRCRSDKSSPRNRRSSWARRDSRCPAKSVPARRISARASKPRRVRWLRIWPLVATPPWLSNNRSSSLHAPDRRAPDRDRQSQAAICGSTARCGQRSPRRASAKCRPYRRVDVQTRSLAAVRTRRPARRC